MILYTDGAYSIRQQRGGIGYLILNDEEDEMIMEVSHFYCGTTSQRAELTAVIEALRCCPLDSYVEVRTDSTYIAEGYIGEYDLKKNLDLWEELRELAANLRLTINYIPRRSDGWARIVDDLAKAGKDMDDA